MPIHHQQSDTDFLGHTLDLYDQQRDQKKAEEDSYLKWQQDTLEHYLNSPLANQDPSVQQGLLQDLHDTVHARFSKRPRQRSMDGFFGATELPHSQMLQSVMGGQRPLTGSPTQDVPPPPSPQQQGLIPEMGTVAPKLQDETGAALPMQGPQAVSTPQPKPLEPPIEPGSIQRRHEEYAKTLAPPAPQPFLPVTPQEAPTGGASVLMSPVGVPPAGSEPSATSSRIAAAGRQMQQFNAGPQVIPVPSQKQPLMLSRGAADQEASNAARMKARGAQTGIYQSDLEAAQQFARQPEDVQGWLRGLRNISRAPNAGAQGRPSLHNAVVNGKQMAVWIDPSTKAITDQAGNPIEGDVVLTGTGATGAGAAYTVRTVTQPDGSVQAVWIPKNPTDVGQDSGIVSAPTNLKQRTPPTPHQLTPSAEAALGEAIRRGSDIPSLGMGGANARIDAINKAFAPGQPSVDLAANRATYKADADSLKVMQKQSDALESFSNTAGKNLVNFLNQAKGIVDSGSPLLNRGLRTLSQDVLGNPQLAAFNTARTVVLPEFARIIANPGMQGVLSDSARHEIEEVLKGDATLPQIYAVSRVLIQDAQNRHLSIQNQITDIKGRLAGQPAPGGATVPQPPPTGGKVVKTAMVEQYAKEHGIDSDKARQVFIDKGYTIVK